MKKILISLILLSIFYSCSKRSLTVPIEEKKTVKDTFIKSFVHLNISEKVRGKRKPIFEIKNDNVLDWEGYTGFFQTSSNAQEFQLQYETNCPCIITFSDIPGSVIADSIGIKDLNLQSSKKYFIKFGKEQ